MPLVDLKTDLRSIRFGSPDAPGDRPNGAWSNQPYITTPIGADFLAPTPNRFAIGKGSDFILRGGASAFVDATTDDIRLGKMFTDLKTPNGIQFIAKQNLLSMTGVNIFAGYPTSVRALNRARLNDGVYTPLSALLAAGPVGNLIGGHPNKQGLDPTGNSFLYSRPQYTNLVSRSAGSETTNRLLNLDKKFIKSNKIGPLFSYLGGPNAGTDVASVNTIINFPKDQITSRTGMSNPLSVTNPTLFFGRGGGTLTGNQQANLSNNSFRTTGKVRDFRKLVTSQTIGVLQHTLARQNGTLTNAPNYNDKNFEKRVNAGNPGNPALKRSNYSSGAIDPTTNRTNVVNKINALYMYNANNVTDNPDSKNDFVKFRFAVINPDTPKKKTFVHFPAFFDGAITDNMGASWSSFKYLGRGEEFFNYEGFSRDVSFSFQVAAQSKPELSIMYQKLNYLQSTLAPNFSTNGFMRGNIHQLTIGGYFYEQPGVITSLNYTMPSESPWEIGIPSTDSSTTSVGGIKYRDPAVKELTHIINVSVSFKPIQRFLPQTVGSPFDTTNPNGIFGKQAINQKFIQLANGGGIGENLYDLGLPNAIIQPNPQESLPDLAISEIELEEIPEDEFGGQFNFINPLDDFDSEITRLELLDRG
jgi:hypothetical protein